jgi:hypothetical protein
MGLFLKSLLHCWPTRLILLVALGRQSATILSRARYQVISAGDWTIRDCLSARTEVI